MKVSQIIKKPTPKQFILISFAYAILVSFVGSIVATPLVAGLGLFVSVIFAMVTFLFLRHSLPKTFMNFGSGLIWLVLILIFFNEYHILSIDIPTTKSELHQVSGVMPSEKSKPSEHSEALKINGIFLHCDLATYDYCSPMFENENYEQGMVTAYYQPISLFGNLVYEMAVHGDTVYRYENQMQKFKTLKREKQIQWLWTLLLYGLPSFWFMVQNKRIVKSIPKMTDAEFEQMKAEQKNSNGFEYYFVGVMMSIIAVFF